MPRKGTPSAMSRLAKLLRPQLWPLIGAVGALTALAGVNMLAPYFLMVLLNDVFPEKRWGLLAWVLAGVLGMYLARNGLFFLGKRLAIHSGQAVCFALRTRLFERLQQLSLGFYRRHQPGSVTNRVMGDTFAIQGFIQDALPTLLQALAMFIGLLCVMYAINWPLALASTIVLPLHLLAYRWFHHPIKRTNAQAHEQVSRVYGSLTERLLGMEVVKLFGGGARENRQFGEAVAKSHQRDSASKTYFVAHKVVADLLVGLATVGLLVVGAWQVMKPENPMPAGTFMGFYAYVGMLYPTVLEVMGGFAQVARVTGSVERVFEMIECEQDEGRHGAAVQDEPMRGRVRFEAVSFRYGPDNPLVLNQVSFTVEPGQVCAIIGPCGAGKSTLVHMLPRFFDPDMGRVSIDNVDVKRIDLGRLRGSMAVAFQECFLFNSSVHENLRYARPDATDREIQSAAQDAGAHGFIAALPQGYETLLGEGGVMLSRGEKQKLALTRAMLKRPRILILDEATSSIDPQAEASVMEHMLGFMKGRTTLLVTHRPELIEYADQVVRIEGGRVVYDGPPQGLHERWMEPRVKAPSPLRPTGTTGIFGALIMLAALWLGSLGAPAAHAQEQEAVAADQLPATADTFAAPAQEGFGKAFPMPGMNAVEVGDLLEAVLLRYQAEMNYRDPGGARPGLLPPAPADVVGLRTLVAADPQDGLRAIQAGYQVFQSQPVHVWLYGWRRTNDQALHVNPDLERFGELLEAARAVRAQAASDLTVRELEARRIELSHVEAARCAQMLTLFGFNVLPAGGAVDPKVLPAIVSVPETANHGLVGDGGDPLKPAMQLTVGDPVQEIMVFYDPARPSQFAQVLEVIRRHIDVPDRQIMIEAMVLEISETGLKRLGVEWDLMSPTDNLDALKIGRVPGLGLGTEEEATLNIEFSDIFGNLRAVIRALVREGNAEVLSQPSVLTLNNRLAFINIIEKLPIVQSITTSNNNNVLVSFVDKTVGITLAVRPRIAAEGEQVNMQVIAKVAAKVPNADVVVFNSDGDEVARSPTITEREVRNHTRVANNTPFIIGGLRARDDLTEFDKVPILGDLPFLGMAFRNERTVRSRREVIIIITPRVLPETMIANPAMPEDKPTFDSFGNKLFRSAYRIRTEDVFDLTFLTNNPNLMAVRHLAGEAVRRDAGLAERYPFNQFVADRFPGEHIMVIRQMYEVVKRLELDRQISEDRVLFFEPTPGRFSPFTPRFLGPYLRNTLDHPEGRKGAKTPLLAGLGPRAIRLTYTLRPEGNIEQVLNQPVPEIVIEDCPDPETWNNLLWRYNQPNEQGLQRHSILIQNEGDLTRLKRAAIVKQMVELNAADRGLTMDNFRIGKQLLIPTIKEDSTFLIGSDVARLFFHSEQYYPAVEQQLERDVEALRDALIQMGLMTPDQWERRRR